MLDAHSDKSCSQVSPQNKVMQHPSGLHSWAAQFDIGLQVISLLSFVDFVVPF
jgi:hypothetical protein